MRLLLTAILLLSPSLPAQSPSPLDLLYSHFVGTWQGTDHVFVSTPPATIPVSIVITEDKRHSGLRMEYTYGTKGKKGYGRFTRFLSISPEASTVTIQVDESKVVYGARGLEQLIANGQGTFTLAKAFRFDPVTIYHGTFNLTPDTFSYYWEKSFDGVKFVKTGHWILTRNPPVP